MCTWEHPYGNTVSLFVILASTTVNLSTPTLSAIHNPHQSTPLSIPIHTTPIRTTPPPPPSRPLCRPPAVLRLQHAPPQGYAHAPGTPHSGQPSPGSMGSSQDEVPGGSPHWGRVPASPLGANPVSRLHNTVHDCPCPFISLGTRLSLSVTVALTVPPRGSKRDCHPCLGTCDCRRAHLPVTVA